MHDGKVVLAVTSCKTNHPASPLTALSPLLFRSSVGCSPTLTHAWQHLYGAQIIQVAHPQSNTTPHEITPEKGDGWLESVVSGDGSVQDVLVLDCEGCEKEVVQALLKRQEEGRGGVEYKQVIIALSK